MGNDSLRALRKVWRMQMRKVGRVVGWVLGRGACPGGRGGMGRREMRCSQWERVMRDGTAAAREAATRAGGADGLGALEVDADGAGSHHGTVEGEGVFGGLFITKFNESESSVTHGGFVSDEFDVEDGPAG